MLWTQKQNHNRHSHNLLVGSKKLTNAQTSGNSFLAHRRLVFVTECTNDKSSGTNPGSSLSVAITPLEVSDICFYLFSSLKFFRMVCGQ